MNDPNKAISVNLSSLLSLKAELLRKQQEVKAAKANLVSANEFKPPKAVGEKSKLKKDGNYTEVSKSEDVKVYEAEDYAQLDKSRRVLEAKSKFYDRMSRSGGSLNSDDNCLVMFNRKRQEEGAPEEQRCETQGKISSSSSDSESESDNEGDADDEVEYTDCLGRTRKCLRKELQNAKRLDRQLAESMPERLDQTKANWMIDTQGNQAKYDDGSDDEEPMHGPQPTESIFSEALSTMTKHDEQRINWERQENENLEKTDVHYQDVFFDEARTHGVGYYAFSTDEDERRQQQRELEAARKATNAEQIRRDELRAKRDRIVADRVLAAKNRIRARNGLPLISKEEYEREQQQKAAEAKMEETERNREEQERKAEADRQKAAEEAERAELRKEHVRDWDRNKDGVAKKSDADVTEEWQYRAERLPMSQEQWNEQQRAVRNTEFAPVPETECEPLKRTNFSAMPPPQSFLSGSSREFSAFHSSSREKQFQRRNYTTAADQDDNDADTRSHQGAAIPPPAELDAGYVGPTFPKRAKSQAELESSIEAGLKFLRENCDKGVLANKATWTAKADY